MTKIKYSKNHLKGHFRMGMSFVIIGVILILLYFITGNWKGIPILSIGIGQIGGSVFMFSIYFYQHKMKYLTLKNGVLTKNTLFQKVIKMSEVTDVKEFSGDLKLLSKTKEFVFDTQIIEPTLLIELKEVLKNLSKIGY